MYNNNLNVIAGDNVDFNIHQCITCGWWNFWQQAGQLETVFV